MQYPLSSSDGADGSGEPAGELQPPKRFHTSSLVEWQSKACIFPRWKSTAWEMVLENSVCTNNQRWCLQKTEIWKLHIPNYSLVLGNVYWNEGTPWYSCPECSRSRTLTRKRNKKELSFTDSSNVNRCIPSGGPFLIRLFILLTSIQWFFCPLVFLQRNNKLTSEEYLCICL